MTKRKSQKSQGQETKASDAAGHLERINALLKWWGAPVIDFSTNENQLRCLQEFTDGIQNLYREASARQRQLLGEAGRDVSARLSHLAWPRKPSEILGIQSAMAAKLLDGMSQQSRLWVDVAEGFVDRYSAFAKGTAKLGQRRPDGPDNPAP